MKARKLPSGNWICEGSYTDSHGKRHRKSFTADTKRSAEDQAIMYRLNTEVVSRDTVSALVKDFIEQKRPVLSPSTIRSYCSMLRAIDEFYPDLARSQVDNLTDRDIQRFINDLSKDHSPKTVRNYYALLTSSLPLRTSILRSVTLPQRKRPDYHIPDSNAVQTILEACKGTELEIPVLLASVCTMRAGEICSLSLSDIKKNTIHICRNMVRDPENKWITKTPKTYSSDRFVEAPSWLVKKIRAQGYITHHTPSSLSIAFGRMLTRNGLPRCRFHDLRHYSASYMHAQGIPTAYIMKRGGWNTETVLNAVYRHALDDEEKEQNKKINAEFSKVFSF